MSSHEQDTLSLQVDAVIELRNAEKYDSALALALELAPELIRRDKKQQLGTLYIQMGSILCINHQCLKGKEYYHKALAIGEELKNQNLINSSRLGIGASFIEEDKFDSAAFYLEKNVYSAMESGDSLTAAGISSNLGYLALQDKNYASAKRFYNRALDMWWKLKKVERQIDDLHNLGRVLFFTQQLDSAIILQHYSLRLADSLNVKAAMSHAAFELGKYYYIKSQYQMAYDYQLMADTLGVFTNQEFQKTLSEISDEFIRTELELKNEIQEAKLENTQKENVILLIGIVFTLSTGALVLYILNRRRIIDKQVARKNQEIAEQKINELLQQQEINSLQGVLSGQETERKRIASDLHDKLGAILSMVKLHFSAVEDRIDNLKEENKTQYDKANELLDQAAVEVRNISHNLISGVLTKFGLVPALKDLKETIESTGKLKVQLIVSDMSERLTGEQELQIYRVIQELVSNILKHAKATEAVIQLNKTDGHFNLMVEDNGIGFDVQEVKKKDGLGLKNLEARIIKLHGSLHFDSGKGAGTTVSIDIPLDHD